MITMRPSLHVVMFDIVIFLDKEITGTGKLSLFRERKRSSASSVFFDHAFFTEYLNYRHRSSYTQFFVEEAANNFST